MGGCSHMRRKTPHNRGFTVIELAVVILIAGLALAAAIDLYRQYLRANYIKIVDDRVATIHKAIEDYVNDSIRNPYHLLPCPADPTLPSTDPMFGQSSVGPNAANGYPCPNTFAPSGGVRRFQGIRTWDPAQGIQPSSWGAIREGAVPVRTLNLGDEYASTPAGYLYIYAVSEELANLLQTPDYPPNTPPSQNDGAIDIRQPPGTLTAHSLVTPPGSALYVVIAPWKDGSGAYNTNGTLSPVAAKGYDLQNRTNNNGIYIKAPYSD